MALVNEEIYGPDLAMWILKRGRLTWAVADRWMLGWPDRVQDLLTSGRYCECLAAQVEREKDVLCEVDSTQRHLAEHEILALAEIPLYPPVLDAEPAESYL